MSKYKKIMFDKGIMQKEVLDKVRCTDPRIDKSLLSKIVNDICLPTPPALACICKSLGCDVLDVYDVREIQLVPPEQAAGKAVATATERTRRRRASNDFYNLTVEIPRDLAERVFSKKRVAQVGVFEQKRLRPPPCRRTRRKAIGNRGKRKRRRRCRRAAGRQRVKLHIKRQSKRAIAIGT